MFNRVSILVPVFNNADTLRHLVSQVSKEVAKVSHEVQFVFVDDCSQDRSKEVLSALECDIVHVISNAQNIGQQSSIFKGLSSCDGQAVVVMDADLQDPPQAIPDLLHALETGSHDVVFAARIGSYQSNQRMFFSKGFRFLLKRLTNLPVGAGGFLAMTDNVAFALSQRTTSKFYLIGLIGCAGYRIHSIPVRRNYRIHGKSAYSAKMRFSLGLSNIALILKERFYHGR